ncbi:serine/threonine protein phosphatase, partial [Trypanosoma cruzi]
TEREAFSSCRPRRARRAGSYRPSPPPRRPPPAFGRKTLRRKGRRMIVAQKSHTATWGPRRVDEVFDPRRVRASFACLRSAENPERGISRGCVFTLQGLAKGGGGVLWLQDPKARRFLSNKYPIRIE